MTLSVPVTPTTVVTPPSRRAERSASGVLLAGPASPPPPHKCTCRSMNPGTASSPVASRVDRQPTGSSASVARAALAAERRPKMWPPPMRSAVGVAPSCWWARPLWWVAWQPTRRAPSMSRRPERLSPGCVRAERSDIMVACWCNKMCGCMCCSLTGQGPTGNSASLRANRGGPRAVYM